MPAADSKGPNFDLQRNSRWGPMVLLLRRGFGGGIGLIAAVVLPRLVPPHAYGLAAISAVIFSFADVIKDVGLTSALMRKRDVDPAEINLLFWFNVLSTSVTSLALLVLAPSIAAFYRQPELAPIIEVSTIALVVSGVAHQHRSLLLRDLRFTQFAAIEATAALTRFLVTVALALRFHNVWAIVLGGLIGQIVGDLLAIVTTGWSPQRPRWSKESREIAWFGLDMSLASVAAYIGSNATTFIFGRIFSSNIVGYYSNTKTFLAIPQRNVVDPIAQASMPVLALLSNDPVEYRRYYLKLVQRLTIVMGPASIVLFFVASPLLVTLLGPRWLSSGEMLQALAPTIAVLGINCAIDDLFVTQNRGKAFRRVGMADMALRVGAASLAFVASPVVTLYCFSAATLVSTLLRVVVAGARGPVSAMDHLRACVAAVAPALGAFLGCLIVSLIAASHPWPPVLFAALCCLAACGLATAFALAARPSRQVVLDLFRAPAPAAGVAGDS
jgi:PST family polysaccharide transporter